MKSAIRVGENTAYREIKMKEREEIVIMASKETSQVEGEAEAGSAKHSDEDMIKISGSGNEQVRKIRLMRALVEARDPSSKVCYFCTVPCVCIYI